MVASAVLPRWPVSVSPAVPPASIKAEDVDTPQAAATVLPSVTTTMTMAAVVAAVASLAVRFRETMRTVRPPSEVGGGRSVSRLLV